LPDEHVSQVNSLIRECARSIGLDWGVIKGDLILHQGRLGLIELAARPSGGDFSESLILHGSGINVVEQAIEMCVGNPPNWCTLRPTSNLFVANRYWFGTDGRLVRVEIPKEISSAPWLKKICFFRQIGDKVTRPKNHSDRIGVFVVAGENAKDLEMRINEVYERVVIEIAEEGV